MAQHITKLVTEDALLCNRNGKLVHVYIAKIAAGSKLELYNDEDAADSTKLFYKVDGSVGVSHIDISYPFSKLYADITGTAEYNVIFD